MRTTVTATAQQVLDEALGSGLLDTEALVRLLGVDPDAVDVDSAELTLSDGVVTLTYDER